MASGAQTAKVPYTPLSWQLRAELFAQLAATEKAGLPTQQAVGLLGLPQSFRARVAMTGKWLARGDDMATAGRRSGLFTELEANLVAAACSAGSPAPTYKRLAEYYAQRAAQLRTVKSRMLMPGFTLLTGLFVQPLPALVGGTLGMGGYLLHCFMPLALIAAAVALCAKLFRLREGAPSGSQGALDDMVMRVPLFGKMLVRRNIRDFFESLALMLEAGMPILQALPKALDTIQLQPVRKAFAAIKPRIERGGNLTQALADVPYLNDGQAHALVNTGEAAGGLPEMLFHYAAIETGAINGFNQQVAEWLPRIVYAAVAGWVAYGILTGAGVGPNMPGDL